MMSDSTETPPVPRKHFWGLTWVEILTIAVIAVLLYLLLSSETQYVADGTRDIPVRVFVFDVETGEPVRGAEVGILKAPGLYDIEDRAGIAHQFTGLRESLRARPVGRQSFTDEHGLATFQESFSSGSSNKHPQTRVFPAKFWVVVQGEGFRGIVISLGREAVEYSEVKQGGGFLVPIRIMSDITPPK